MYPIGPFITLSEAELWAIMCALVLMAFDVVVGLVGAFVRHAFKSLKMREGLGHKAMLVLIVCLAFTLQGFTVHVADLGFNVPLIVPVCVYICLMEVASILETVAETVPDLKDTPLFGMFGHKEKGNDND